VYLLQVLLVASLSPASRLSYMTAALQRIAGFKARLLMVYAGAQRAAETAPTHRGMRQSCCNCVTEVKRQTNREQGMRQRTCSISVNCQDRSVDRHRLSLIHQPYSLIGVDVLQRDMIRRISLLRLPQQPKL
jgi:hypothetical protein